MWISNWDFLVNKRSFFCTLEITKLYKNKNIFEQFLASLEKYWDFLNLVLKLFIQKHENHMHPRFLPILLRLQEPANYNTRVSLLNIRSRSDLTIKLNILQTFSVHLYILYNFQFTARFKLTTSSKFYIYILVFRLSNGFL